MTSIDRDRFSRDLSRRVAIDLSRPAPAVRQALGELGLATRDLRGLGDGDHVIRGQAEFEQLYERLQALDRERPVAGGAGLDRATQLYQALVAQGASGAPEAAPGALTRAGQQRLGAGRATREVETFVRSSAEVDARVAELRALPPAAPTARARPLTPVSAYLDAVEAREAAGRRGGARAPAGVPAEVWNLTAALERQGISAADVRHYLATGQLPDLLDAHGEVLQNGADRLAALEHAAGREGSWSAVNSFTSLVGMRRSALAAERQAAEVELARLPADDPQRAALEAFVGDSRALDQALHRGLNDLYSAATHARERTSQALVLQADRLDQQARSAREANDPTRATQLERRAQDLRDRGARMAHAEATYRAGLRGTGWDASSSFLIAAEAQVARGRAELEGMRRGGQLSPSVPAALTDAADAGNGVPGAGRLVADARTHSPTRGRDHRTLAVEGLRQDGIAAFHQAHLVRGNYFDRPSDTGAVRPRGEALLTHRRQYLEARASQADAAGARLELYGPPAQLQGGDALAAARVTAERRGVLDELQGALGQSMASERAAAGARAQRDAAATGVLEARAAAGDARTNLTSAREGVGRAVDQERAVFGDTFKTSGESRRDAEGVRDARAVARAEEARERFAARRVELAEAAHGRAGAEVGRAELTARRDAQDADLVRRALAGHRSLAPQGASDVGAAYRAVRVEADRTAVLGGEYVARAEAQLPRREPQRTSARVELAAARLDLGSYWTRSTELDAAALGDPGRRGATARLDTAAGHLDAAELVRAELPVDHRSRAPLAAGVIEGRAALAEANADYRPGVSRDQLAAAERVWTSDLEGGPHAEAARGRIGAAATTSLVRHDLRFGEVLAGGGPGADADDALYRQAHRMLDGDRGGAAPEVQRARETLGRVDRALDAVSGMLSASGAQLANGQAYAEAQTRSMGRSEIAAAQAQVSTVISGGAYLLSFGHFDMKDQMADAGESATRMRISIGRGATETLTRGQEQLSSAWEAARGEGRAFELLGNLRIFSDVQHRERHPEAYQAAFAFIDARVPAGSAHQRSDWQAFNRVAIRGTSEAPPAVPVARALVGPVLGYERAQEALGDRSLGMITRDMRDMMESQAGSLQDTTRNMGWIIAINASLEVGLGIVATGGLGSAGAVAEAGNAVNAGRTGVQAMQAVRSAGTVARAGELLSAARAAHPVMYSVGVATTAGAGMMGVSWGARQLFGASSGVSRGVDVAAAFVPIGVGHRAAGLGGAGERAAVLAAERAGAGERAAGRLGAAREAVSAERLLAHGRFYGPQLALGGGQAFVTALAVPAAAEYLEVRSELGQAAIGLALNTVMTGSIAAGMARRAPARARADAVTPHLMEAAQRADAAAAGRVRADVEGFLRRTEGRVPTQAEAAALTRSLSERLGIPRGGDEAAARRQHVEATVEALRVERAGELGLREAGARGRGPLTEPQAARAVEVTAERLFEARGGEAGGASRVQAYRDALEVVVRRVGDGAPEAMTAAHRAAVDRAQAAELATSFAVAVEGRPPVIGSAAQRARVESILAGELGPMRRALETGEGRSLTDATGGPSAYERLASRLTREGGLSREGAESVLRGAQHDLVERGILARVQAEQARAPGPLSAAQLEGLARGVAERAGMEPGAARDAARDLVARAGFVDWARSQLPADRWTPAMHREHFLATAHADARAELGGLTAAEFQAMYPSGALPRGLDVVGRIQGFGAFARARPAEARALAEAVTLFPGGEAYVRQVVQQQGPAGFQQAAQALQPMLPVVTPHPTEARYTVVQRGPQSPNTVPAYNLRPRLELDHNGAFFQGAQVQGRLSGERRVPTPNVDFRVPHPSQLVVRGQPLANLDHVLVFSGHGGLRGFSGLSTRQAATLVADQIAAARNQGQRIDHVVLDACHQRDRRWFVGGSNAEAFQRELSQALTARGLGGQAVTVLAADRGGPTYGTSQRSYLPWHRDQQGNLQWGHGFEAARYTPASDGGRFFVSQADLLIGGGLAGAGAEAYLIYRVVSERREAEERRQGQQPAAPR